MAYFHFWKQSQEANMQTAFDSVVSNDTLVLAREDDRPTTL